MMKRLPAIAICILLSICSFAQQINSDANKNIVTQYLRQNQQSWNLTENDITGWTFSDMYSNKATGITYLYVHQEVGGVRIYKAVSAVTVRDGKVLSFGKRIYPSASSKINTLHPSLTETEAIQKAADYLGLSVTEDLKAIGKDPKSNESIFSAGGISQEPIHVGIVFQPVKNALRLAWNINIHLLDDSHWWNVRIDAVTGEYLDKNDWTVHCEFDNGQPASTNNFAVTPVSQPVSPALPQQSSLLPAYNVYPLPIESPNFGTASLVNNPADAIASPFGWHDTDGAAGAEYTITRGNNVYAYDDIADQNTPGFSADGTSSLTFNFPYLLAQQPGTYLDAATVNLFYVNNAIHDMLYHNGFDEASGNFQENNYGNGGIGGDYVEAEAQDGGGTNNANFSTPNDGGNGRMQMYLWTGGAPSFLTVNSPGSIAGNYAAMEAGFGPAVSTTITSDFVLADDGVPATADACDPLVNGASMGGKIVVMDRGICNFVDKVLAAQAEGAVAAIIINNAAGAPFAMGDNGNGASVTIPSVMISLADGNIIKNEIALGNTVNGSLNPPSGAAVDVDGSLDNGIVVHEFGHGVSNRLTGGPSNSNCLGNGEQAGEGWSDYFGLLFTLESGDLGTDSRGIGTYALRQLASGSGIRRFPYSTDMSVNPQTYADLALSPEVHDIGEIWCMAVWEMTWAFIDQFGFDPDWINGTSGNNIALKLVMEGMKLQPCGPGFLDARDAILLADENLYGGIHKCLIWTAFAKRGMGFDAVQGSSDVAGDETAGFTLPTLCQTPTSAPSADFIADVTSTCHGIVNFTDQSTDIPQGWSWDFGDGGTSILQNPSHTYLTNGTFTVKLVVTNTLGADSLIRTSYITVSFPSAPVVNGDTAICAGDTTSLTATPAAGNAIEWRDISNNVLFTGNTFNTPPITAATTYNAYEVSPSALQNVGPVNNTFGTGGYHNTSFEGKEIFTAFTPLRIVSVWVDASGVANRTFNLYNSGGTLLQSITANVPTGQSRVTLNFDITTPGNYQMGVTAGSNLYRNNSGAVYPYAIAGLLSITSSNSTSNPATYYYYVYDWEVQELPCVSPAVAVNISVSTSTPAFAFTPTSLSCAFTDQTLGTISSWAWDFGDGQTSSLQNPTHVYANPGTYTVMLVVTNSDGCSSAIFHSVTVINTGIQSLSSDETIIFSNEDKINVIFPGVVSEAFIQIYDMIGQELISAHTRNTDRYQTVLKDFSEGFVMISVQQNNKIENRKLFISK
jgi:PKD repeat protein